MKGRRIDRYELHELIGEGGMGAVYRAVDSRLGRTVALKTVVSHRSGEGLTNELRQRFMREALAASKVDHRNVVQVIDFGVADDGTPYLVMEYLRGRDLGVVLKAAKEPLAIAHVADIVLCVCAALRACHQQGVVHRDLKPSNIFLADTDTGPEIKVLDFGVSKAQVAGELTQEGQILGTPQYLSPEQVNGKVGPESDQYALGVLLYVCLTKKLPFEEHQNLSLLRAIEVGRFPGPRLHRPEIPPALEAIVLRAMSADPRARFPSVHALGQALWSFASARGQIEWKNYYFPATPAEPAGDAPVGGLPASRPGGGAPAVERTAVLPPADRTALLAAPDDAVPDRARDQAHALFVRAGERAESLGAPGEAQRYYAQAAGLTDDEVVRAGLFDRAGQMATRGGRSDDATELFEQAIRIYDAAGDTHAAARVTSRLAFGLERAGRHEHAIQRMEAAYAVIGDDEPDADLAFLTVRLGNALLFVGQLDWASLLIERALDMGEALALPEILVFGWGAKGVLAATRGRRQESRMLLSAAAELALEQGLLERAGVALGNLSDQAFAVDAYEEALGYLARTLELARKTGDRPNEWFSHSESTYPLFQLGRWDEAMAALAEVPTEQLPSGHTLISPLTSVVEIHLNRGRLDDARALLEIFSRLSSSVDVQERIGYAASAAAIAHAEGRYADALDLGEQVLAARDLMGDTAQAVKQGLHWAAEAAYALGRLERLDEILQMVEHQPPGLRSQLMEAQARRLRARVAEGMGEADALYTAAERQFESLGLAFWLAVTRLEHAELLRANGGDGDPAALVAEARATFMRLGATPWIARADAIAPALQAEPAP